MRSRAILIGGLAAVALGAPAPAGTAVRGSPNRLPVLGFQSEDSPPRSISRDAAGLTAVGVDGIDLEAPGSVDTPDGAALRQLRAAHRRHLPAELLVGNWSNAI